MNKVLLHDLNTSGIQIPVSVKGWLPSIKTSIKQENLTIFHKDGMYWLLPIEVQKELTMLVEYRDRTKNDCNTMPPINITLEQCISIPGETARILLGL